ncbi:adiponectin receptor protein isoform X2 [Tenebrio molitor]|uniref:adiponectin receptor protein isoform X2 n=1 Tax=Tenebrio molitor TaxID=7067 RepID=UPI0036246AE3
MSHYSDAEDSIDVADLGLRKRKLWDPETESITSEIKELLDEDVNSLVEEDCIGCPLPSTPEDENMLDSEMSDVLKAAVLAIAIFFLMRPTMEIELQEKIVFGAFFAGAIICLGMSFMFHTVNCHSQFIGKLFSKLDYCGIAMLIMGSFVPWVYYGFYCHFRPKVVYLSVVCALGITSIMVSLWDKFSESGWRPFRAAVFMTFGLSGIVPAIHYGIVEGWFNKVSQKSLGWLILMGLLYIMGAMLYALRVPERWFPGKFDIWLHSHQIFHVFVLGGAFVHYHGISEMAMYRVTIGQCEMPDIPIY